jgi:hypothetical protein
MPCYGDNLCVPRDHVQDEGVDLICPDPPFNSNANVLFKSPAGHNNDAQIGPSNMTPLLESGRTAG